MMSTAFVFRLSSSPPMLPVLSNAKTMSTTSACAGRLAVLSSVTVSPAASVSMSAVGVRVPIAARFPSGKKSLRSNSLCRDQEPGSGFVMSVGLMLYEGFSVPETGVTSGPVGIS